ncbi:MAG: CoA-acylating methylmalonate-semialdehyde dehydrogenase [Verrucomicrobiota bacterium JB024]|nr:CoA-acylating methylmalonate-semialdehyde dehydrogenase [Verrucomicrobiota bacterium JB024]
MPSPTLSTDIITLQNRIGGQLVASSGTEYTAVNNPSHGMQIARTPHSTASDVDQAVAAAKEAFASWKATPVLKRASIMFRYRELLEQHFDELAALVTRENGKTIPESQGDVRRGIEVVELASGIASQLKGGRLPNIAGSIDGESSREPIGVCAGITPFNFPAMVPMWMFPLAIACGNTFVLKPSEKTPLTAMRLAELATEAGLPGGVLNVVNGAQEAVERLCTHPDIAAVSFVGSTKVAEIVYRTASHAGKRVQSAGGAKNAMVVMPDADLDSTVRAIIGAAYGCAGQRCMAGSTVLAVGPIVDELVARLKDAIGEITLLPTDEHPDAGMGAVIDASARERLLKTIDHIEADGLTLVADGRKGLPEAGYFVGPTLVDGVTVDKDVAQTELFGPVLTLGRVHSLPEAIDWANSTGYGNGAVIFTKDGGTARYFKQHVQCGMIGVNVGVPAAMAAFSFSGWNRSFFGDLHVQGEEGVYFYTRQQVSFTRWDDEYVRTQGW